MPARPFDEVRAEFESALTRAPCYGPVISAFRALEIPGDVTDEQLTSLYSICYAILSIEPSDHTCNEEGLDHWQAGHLIACAREEIEQSMYDPNASTRAWIERSKQRFRDRGEPVPDEYEEDELPPALEIPWDEETAWSRIRPFLDRCEEFIAREPLFHLPLCWKVHHDGYPVFQSVIQRWMKELDAKGLGPPDTIAAFAKAVELSHLGFALEDAPWSRVETELISLLEHSHPMVAAGAARCLGELYADEDFDFDSEDEDGAYSETRPSGHPGLVEILERLRKVNGHRVHVAGGFICGFDESAMGGMHGLSKHPAVKAARFDFDQWVLDILAREKEEPYLPNTQSFWFYVHEHYDFDPQFCMRLIDNDRSFVALMCATEQHEPVQGMKPVLQRLAEDDDEEIAHAARQHLTSVYET